jgi:hypothetical protein
MVCPEVLVIDGSDDLGTGHLERVAFLKAFVFIDFRLNGYLSLVQMFCT